MLLKVKVLLFNYPTEKIVLISQNKSYKIIRSIFDAKEIIEESIKTNGGVVISNIILPDNFLGYEIENKIIGLDGKEYDSIEDAMKSECSPIQDLIYTNTELDPLQREIAISANMITPGFLDIKVDFSNFLGKLNNDVPIRSVWDVIQHLLHSNSMEMGYISTVVEEIEINFFNTGKTSNPAKIVNIYNTLTDLILVREKLKNIVIKQDEELEKGEVYIHDYMNKMQTILFYTTYGYKLTFSLNGIDIESAISTDDAMRYIIDNNCHLDS